MAWLYTVEHRTSGKLYVGQTSERRVERRWNGHVSQSRHPVTPFQFALRKYGRDAFSWSATQWFDTSTEAEQAEVYWIAFLKEMGVVLYNAAEGGRAPMLGRRHTAEAKALVSQKLKGLKRSVETRARMSAAQKGHLVSDAQRARLRELRVGVPSWNKGLKTGPPTDQARRNHTEAMRRIGATTGAFKKGQVAHNKGKRGARHSEATRRKMSASHKDKPNAGQFLKGQAPHNKKYETPEAKREARLAQKREWYRRRKARERDDEAA